MTTRLLSYAGGLLFVAALLGGMYLLGHSKGADATDARWRAGMAMIDAEIGRQQADAQERANTLSAKVEELRAKAQRVRTVTREVVRYVQPDAECSSLPESVRWLWDADGGAPGDGPGSASVGDAAVRAVAGAGR